MKSLFVGNMSFQTTESELRELGSVGSLGIPGPMVEHYVHKQTIHIDQEILAHLCAPREQRRARNTNKHKGNQCFGNVLHISLSLP